MALDAKVFGRPAPASIAQAVMQSPSLSQTPAPSQPADVVEHPNLANYYNALDAVYEILKLEHDPQRRLKADESRAFFESVILTFEEPDESTQQPAPMPPIPPLGVLSGQPGQPSPGSLPGTPPGLPGVPSVPGQTGPPGV